MFNSETSRETKGEVGSVGKKGKGKKHKNLLFTFK